MIHPDVMFEVVLQDAMRAYERAPIMRALEAILERDASVQSRLAALERAGAEDTEKAPVPTAQSVRASGKPEPVSNTAEGAASGNAPLGARAPAVTSCAGSDTPSAAPPRWTEEQREAAKLLSVLHQGQGFRSRDEMVDAFCAEIARVAPLFSAPGAGVTRAELYRAVLHSMASPNKSDQGDAAKVTDAVLALLAHRQPSGVDAEAAAREIAEEIAKLADEQERYEREFEMLATESRDTQRASDFQEGAAIARSIAKAIRANHGGVAAIIKRHTAQGGGRTVTEAIASLQAFVAEWDNTYDVDQVGERRVSNQPMNVAVYERARAALASLSLPMEHD